MYELSGNYCIIIKFSFFNGIIIPRKFSSEQQNMRLRFMQQIMDPAERLLDA